MRALRFETFGNASVLRVEDVPRPVPSAGEALVEVRAAAINPSDVMNVAGRMSQTSLPRTPGRDFAGVVVEGPAEWRGKAVWGTGGDVGFTRDGAHAEALVVPVSALRQKPDRLDFPQAAAAGTPFVVASLALARAGASAGETVLVAGAAGAVGSAAVQIAKWKGAQVAALVRGEEDARYVRSLGVDRVATTGGREASAALEELLGKTRVSLALDTTGFLLDACVSALAHGGRIVAIAAPPDGRTAFALRDFYRREGALFGIDSLALSTVDAAVLLEALRPGFDDGSLLPPRIASVRPLEEGAAAYARRGGKVVLLPHG